MAKSSWACPNCRSEFCSAIRFWKSPQTEFIDTYLCHDCGESFDPATRERRSSDWQPPRPLVQQQVNIFGKIENIRDGVNPVPKLVESAAGLTVCVARIPRGSSSEYRQEVQKMMLEINKKSSGREMPTWYKYRKIKRGNK